MTRGPPPLKAIAKAKKIAALQGEVMNNPALARWRYGLVVFREDRTAFVRIKRIRAHVTDPAEILLLFKTDVLQLRMLPETPVTSREIWTLSPWNTWQFFIIGNNEITEVRYEVPLELPPVEKPAGETAEPDPLPGDACPSTSSLEKTARDTAIPAGDCRVPAGGSPAGALTPDDEEECSDGVEV
ncbi:MAG: hypothetical protein GX651_06510 [Methanomicrobiales archaeon]|nr:hypothetical protein [Methanomicrobiales archaeon]